MTAAPLDPDRKVAVPASASPVSSTTAGDSSTGPWDDQAKRTFVNKEISEYFDPCQEKAMASLRCLRRNDGDRSYCGDYFQAYRDCKKEWLGKVREERKLFGKNAIW